MQSAAALPLPVAVPHRPLRQPNAIHMADYSPAFAYGGYSSHWRNHPAKDPIRNPIPPVTGGITPLRHPSETQTLQSLEESPRSDALQRDKTPSDWKKYLAQKPRNDHIHPVTGRITPQYDLSACGFIQQLEESDDALPYRRQSYAQTRREAFELSTFAYRASLGTKPQGSVES